MVKEGFEQATFETAQLAFMKSFELLEEMHSEKRPFSGPETTKQGVIELHLPTLKACWNALVLMRMLAKNDAQRGDAERHHKIFWHFMDEKKISGHLVVNPLKE
ncbi:hypothetical protein HY969_02350 [Candidatus Kaiserbacteria bacterium]|nr:hypothetical protein [Candidatus Kaiserbacteria bacterium]